VNNVPTLSFKAHVILTVYHSGFYCAGDSFVSFHSTVAFNLCAMSTITAFFFTIVVISQADIIQTFIFFIKLDQLHRLVVWPLHGKQINWPITAWLPRWFPARK